MSTWSLRTLEGLEVFHTVIPRVKPATCGSAIDCLYLAGHLMAKDLSSKISVCPSAWWWHLFKLRSYTKRTSHSLMDSFDYKASQLADQSPFVERTWILTTQFANSDDFLDRVEAELGFDGDDDPSLKGTISGSTNPKTSFEITAMPRLHLPPPLMILTWTLQRIPTQAPSHAAHFFPCQLAIPPTGLSVQSNLLLHTNPMPLHWHWKRNKLPS